MKHLARFSSLVAALCLGIPATGFTHDHGGSHGDHGSWHGDHGSWHGDHGSWHGGHGDFHGHFFAHNRFYGGYFPFYSSYPYYATPYYSTPYYDTSYYDAYYASPSYGLSISSSPTYRTTRADDRADDLAIDVQRALRRDGYYRGGIDGDIGAGTRAAIRQYQYDHSLEVTGRIDRSLLRSLGLD